MKSLRSKMLAACALLGIGGSALGYTWTFTNMTNKTLIIQVILAGWYNVDTDLGVYFNIVRPGENTDFSWGIGNPRAGHCISSIRIAEYSHQRMGYSPQKEELFNRSAKALQRAYFDSATQKRDLKKKLLAHPLRELDIKWLPDATWRMFDDKMQQAAQKLADGTASTIEGAVKLAGYDIDGLLAPLAGATSAFMELLKRSKCMGRHFDIVEKKGQLLLVTKE